MKNFLRSFQVKTKNGFLDYRQGQKLDLVKIHNFFGKKYKVKKIWQEKRHILGLLSDGNHDFFLKLATTSGISIVTKNEHEWNNFYNQKTKRGKNLFQVPKNIECGFLNKRYFYLITENFVGQLLYEKPQAGLNSFLLEAELNNIFLCLDGIERLRQGNSTPTEIQNRFMRKTNQWFFDIPLKVRTKYHVDDVLKMVVNNYQLLGFSFRHGDLAPWHILKLANSRLGLIDGEHARMGVEGYDCGYFLQRVYSVCGLNSISEKIRDFGKDKYGVIKLKTILASRAVGGFLDESLSDTPNFDKAAEFASWIIKIN